MYVFTSSLATHTHTHILQGGQDIVDEPVRQQEVHQPVQGRGDGTVQQHGICMVYGLHVWAFPSNRTVCEWRPPLVLTFWPKKSWSMTSSWQCRLQLVRRGFRSIFSGEYNQHHEELAPLQFLNNQWRKTLTSEWKQLEAELLMKLWYQICSRNICVFCITSGDALRFGILLDKSGFSPWVGTLATSATCHLRQGMPMWKRKRLGITVLVYPLVIMVIQAIQYSGSIGNHLPQEDFPLSFIAVSARGAEFSGCFWGVAFYRGADCCVLVHDLTVGHPEVHLLLANRLSKMPSVSSFWGHALFFQSFFLRNLRCQQSA